MIASDELWETQVMAKSVASKSMDGMFTASLTDLMLEIS